MIATLLQTRAVDVVPVVDILVDATSVILVGDILPPLLTMFLGIAISLSTEDETHLLHHCVLGASEVVPDAYIMVNTASVIHVGDTLSPLLSMLLHLAILILIYAPTLFLL